MQCEGSHTIHEAVGHVHVDIYVTLGGRSNDTLYFDCRFRGGSHHVDILGQWQCNARSATRCWPARGSCFWCGTPRPCDDPHYWPCGLVSTHPQIHQFPCSDLRPRRSSHEQYQADPEEEFAEQGTEEAQAQGPWAQTGPQPKPATHRPHNSPPQAPNAHHARLSAAVQLGAQAWQPVQSAQPQASIACFLDFLLFLRRRHHFLVLGEVLCCHDALEELKCSDHVFIWHSSFLGSGRRRSHPSTRWTLWRVGAAGGSRPKGPLFFPLLWPFQGAGTGGG